MRSLSITEKLMPSPWLPSRRVVSYISTSGLMLTRDAGKEICTPKAGKFQLPIRMPLSRSLLVKRLACPEQIDQLAIPGGPGVIAGAKCEIARLVGGGHRPLELAGFGESSRKGADVSA